MAAGQSMPDDLAMLWRFRPVDSWYFGHTRPVDPIGGSWVESAFPPPARTVLGAVRAALADYAGGPAAAPRRANAIASPRRKEVRSRGFDDPRHVLGRLAAGAAPGGTRVTGPFPMVDGQRLLPLPSLFWRFVDAGGRAFRLSVQAKEPVLAAFSGPAPPSRLRMLGASTGGLRSEPIERGWVTEVVLKKILQGDNPRFAPPPETADILTEEHLLARELRVGIGIDAARRIAADERLFMVEHLRPRMPLEIGIVIHGQDPAKVPKRGVVRFGAEGRLATYETAAWTNVLAPPQRPNNWDRETGWLLLTFVSHADLGGIVPLQFGLTDEGGGSDFQVWRGSLFCKDGVEVRVDICAGVGGRCELEGGWNRDAQQPRSRRPLIPAGTTWLCRLAGPDWNNDAAIDEAISRLNGIRIGQDTHLGRGEIRAGFTNG